MLSGAVPRPSAGLSRPSQVAYDELCRQLAFRAADDVASFDVIRLAYSLLTYYSVTTQFAGTTTTTAYFGFDIFHPLVLYI